MAAKMLQQQLRGVIRRKCHRSSLQSQQQQRVLINAPPPPRPKKCPFERSKHGKRWRDPYHWMRDSRTELVEHLHLENAYADECMAATRPLQRQLEREMRARLPPASHEMSSPAERIGPWLYYTRVPDGKECPVYFRKKYLSETSAVGLSWRWLMESVVSWDDDTKEEVLLDQNDLVEEFGMLTS